MNILSSKSFPQVNNVSYVSERNDFLAFHSLADTRNELIQVLMKLVYPTLLVSLAGCERVNLRDDADHTCDDTSLRLSA